MDSWWEPTWRRLVGSTVVLFLVILAFLVGRERAGADPGLARETTGTTTQQVAPQGSGADPTDPFGGATPRTDPVWTGLGIPAGYLAAGLSLTYYARRRIGARRWRAAHRQIPVAWAMAAVHVIGAGTDAGSLWLQVRSRRR